MSGNSSSDEEMLDLEETAILSIIMARRKRAMKRPRRKTWTNKWLLRRASQGVFSNLLQEIDAEDPEKFTQFHRLNREQFEEVWSKVAPIIEKKDTQMRSCIGSRERLSITLRFLATGKSSNVTILLIYIESKHSFQWEHRNIIFGHVLHIS